MKNLWPASFKEHDFEPPKSIFEQQAKLLPKLTGDLVYAEISDLGWPYSHHDGIPGDFAYGFYLKGKFLQNYSYKVLSFGHGITFYPVSLNINSEIRKELDIAQPVVMVESPGELESVLQRVLVSDRLSKVIGAIMKISK